MKELTQSAIEILKKVKSPSIDDLLASYLYTGYIDYYLDTHSTRKTDIQAIEEFCKMVYIDWRNGLIDHKEELGEIEKAVADALEKYAMFDPANIDAKMKSPTPYYNFLYKGYDKYFRGTGTRPALLQDGKTIMPDEDFIPDGFMHIFGYGITRQEKEPIEARLYLNLMGENIGKFAIEAYKKCKEKGLPFYFKFSSNDDRNDPFLFYSSYKSLAKYVEVIEEIKSEKPELLEGANFVSRNMGVINGYIGYGDEPSLKDESYNSTRKMAFSQIKRELSKKRKDKFVTTQNSTIFATKPKPMTYAEYMEYLLDDFIAKNLVTIQKTKQKPGFTVDIKGAAKRQIKKFILEGEALEDISLSYTDFDLKLPLSKLDLGGAVLEQGGKFGTITELRGILAKFAYFSSTKPNEEERQLNRIVKEQLVIGIKKDLEDPSLKGTAEMLLEKLDRKTEDLDAIGKALIITASASFMETGRIFIHTKKEDLVYDDILPEIYKGVLGEDVYEDTVKKALADYNISQENLCFNQDTEQQLKEKTK